MWHALHLHASRWRGIEGALAPALRRRTCINKTTHGWRKGQASRGWDVLVVLVERALKAAFTH